jgi:hypothetical protein
LIATGWRPFCADKSHSPTRDVRLFLTQSIRFPDGRELVSSAEILSLSPSHGATSYCQIYTPRIPPSG